MCQNLFVLGFFAVFCRYVLEDVAWLAFQYAADGRKGGKTHGFGFACFQYGRLAGVMSTFSASSPSDIFLCAITTSMFTIMGMARGIQMVSFCSSVIS